MGDWALAVNSIARHMKTHAQAAVSGLWGSSPPTPFFRTLPSACLSVILLGLKMWPLHGFPPPSFIDSFLLSLYRLFLWAGDAFEFHSLPCGGCCKIYTTADVLSCDNSKEMHCHPTITRADREKLLIKKKSRSIRTESLKMHVYILRKCSMSLQKRVMICNIYNMSQGFAASVETR